MNLKEDAKVILKPLEWFVAFRDPQEIWKDHPSFLLCEVVFYVLTLLTLRHALSHGGRYKYLWLATILHGLVVESASYFVPDIDNFWHAESMVMFIGKRLPLHVMLIYPCFIYTACAIVARLHLKKWCEPFAVGLAVVLLDVPFDIMGIKLLWWTWHDTDPNVFDRHYWVPWTSYYFHAAFASSFCFIFHGTRALISSKEKLVSAGFFTETFCMLLTAALSMPCGVLQFVGIYHGLHDNCNIHTEVCVIIFLGFYAYMFWSGDRHCSVQARVRDATGWFDSMFLLTFIHYAFYAFLVFVAEPDQIKATGLHEPTGNCTLMQRVLTPLGQILNKRKFLCTSDYHEQYYDFHCLPGGLPPKNGLSSYTICGTPYENHTEYKVVVCGICLMGFTVLYQIMAYSGRQPRGTLPENYAAAVKQGKMKRH